MLAMRPPANRFASNKCAGRKRCFQEKCGKTRAWQPALWIAASLAPKMAEDSLDYGVLFPYLPGTHFTRVLITPPKSGGRTARGRVKTVPMEVIPMKFRPL